MGEKKIIEVIRHCTAEDGQRFTAAAKLEEGIISFGLAIPNTGSGDQFRKRIGKNIALTRAKGPKPYAILPLSCQDAMTMEEIPIKERQKQLGHILDTFISSVSSDMESHKRGLSLLYGRRRAGGISKPMQLSPIRLKFA